jgi:hypothetical protein
MYNLSTIETNLSVSILGKCVEHGWSESRKSYFTREIYPRRRKITDLEGSGIIQSYKRCKSLVRSSEQNAVACVEMAVL